MFKIKRCVLIVLSFLLIGQYVMSAERVPMKLWYDKPAEVWMTSALPVGNGEMGAMFFGGVEREELQFNHLTLWSGNQHKRGAYQNFGSLYFDFETSENCTNYRRELSLDNAVGRVSYTMNGVDYVREYFASHPDRVIVARLTTPGTKGALNFSLRMQDGRDTKTTIQGNLMTIKGKLDLLCYEGQAQVMADGGKVEQIGNRLKVTGANVVTILLTGDTNFQLSSSDYTKGNADDVHRRVSARISRASKKTYKKLLKTHLDDYMPLFAGVELDFDEELPDYPTDKLIREHKDNAYLDMLYFQYGRYLTLSSSRGGQLPSNLQGLWNNVNNPAWECDYHSNINVQMNYWPTEVAGLSECFAPFSHYVATEAMKVGGSWQEVARKEGCRGWTVHTQNNIFGYTDWLINRPAAAWYCTHLWNHYAYTLDVDYLRKTAYPIMKSTCEYWFDRLKENGNGKLVAPDEWSPEHGPWEDGPAYAQQLIYALFKETLSAAEVLQSNDDFITELKEKIGKLDKGLHIGSWGQLKEWSIQEDDRNDHHRHLSHLMALYPGHEISNLHNKVYTEAARISLDARGDGATGWSRAWKVSCWARLWDGERAYRLLKQAQNLTDVTVVSMDDNAGGVYENLFCAHPSFQIDGNFGATAGIAEMLIQNSMKGIHLLPALPKTWNDGHFKGLRTFNGFSVDASWKDGKVTDVEITSLCGHDCHLFMDGLPKGTGMPQVFTKRGRKVDVREKDGMLVFTTQKGKSYHIVFK